MLSMEAACEENRRGNLGSMSHHLHFKSLRLLLLLLQLEFYLCNLISCLMCLQFNVFAERVFCEKKIL